MWSALMHSSVSSVTSEELFQSSLEDVCLAMNVRMMWVAWS